MPTALVRQVMQRLYLSGFGLSLLSMKLYLSSYNLGNRTEQLQVWLSSMNKKVGYVPNAFDFVGMDPDRRAQKMEEDVKGLEDLGFEVETLDLKNYFGKKEQLAEKLHSLNMVWVSGGNVFVLRQAMKLSGFDELITERMKDEDFVYGGYSAAACVLSPGLEAYQIVDEADNFPYDLKETLWKGLGVIKEVFLPHFDSDHPESAAINEELAYCQAHGLPFKTLKDGEVWVLAG